MFTVVEGIVTGKQFPSHEVFPKSRCFPVTIGLFPSHDTETSKYPEEKKSTEIPLVVASERGLALKLH